MRRILIFFGGSDPLNLTGMAIDALCDPEFHELQVDVVVGVNNPHRPLLEEKAAWLRFLGCMARYWIWRI